jgi:hypothetical protein
MLPVEQVLVDAEDGVDFMGADRSWDGETRDCNQWEKRYAGVVEQDEHSDAVVNESAAFDPVIRANELLREYRAECFWFWRPDARVENFEDARLVVHHLREYGDRRAWLAAQGLWRAIRR